MNLEGVCRKFSASNGSCEVSTKNLFGSSRVSCPSLHPKLFLVRKNSLEMEFGLFVCVFIRPLARAIQKQFYGLTFEIKGAWHELGGSRITI